MGRKNYEKLSPKMAHQLQAGKERSLHVSLARTTVKETVKETETETGKEMEGTKIVIVIVSETVETRSAIRVASRTGNETETAIEGRIMTGRVGARDTTDMKTMTAMDATLHETTRGETGIGTEMSIKTKIGKDISPQNTGIIEIRTKMREGGMVEETAKRDTVLEIGLMMRLHRSVTRERGVPRYTGKKGLGRSATCMTIACKMIELKKSVALFRLLQ